MIYPRKPKQFNSSFEVVSCFCEVDGQILLLRRLEHKSQGKKWGVPAGKVNKDEDKVVAMMREINEETGISVLPTDLNYFKSIYVHHTFDFVYHMYHYQIKQIPQVNISENEHDEYAWALIDDALKLPLVDDLDECIKMFYVKN